MPTPMQTFARSFSAFPVSAGDKIVVAVSGGADSICLLHLLLRLSASGGFTLHVAHLNHQFRPEADREAQFVARRAALWGLPATIESQPVGALSKAHGFSKQAGARHFRYRFLQETAEHVGARWIATAHTADDQAETFLMRLLRGAGRRGLAGIPPMRDGNLLRPMLHLHRPEIVAELRRARIDWVEDPSNSTAVYLRNRIRHDLLPRLEKENPKIRTALCRLSQVLRDEDDWMTQETARQMSRMATCNADQVIFGMTQLESLHPAVQRRALRWGMAQLTQCTEEGVPFGQIEALRGMIAGASGAMRHLPFGIEAARGAGTLILQRRKPPASPGPDEVILNPPDGVIDLPTWRIRLICTYLEQPATLPKTTEARMRAIFDADKMRSPLTLRGWRNGDRFIPTGMTSHKKLQDFFIDAKIPRAARRSIPLLTACGDIAWIVGHRQDARYRATPATRLRLVIDAVPLFSLSLEASPGKGEDRDEGARVASTLFRHGRWREDSAPAFVSGDLGNTRET